MSESIYLAGRYGRKAEIKEAADILETKGYRIASRWVYNVGEEPTSIRHRYLEAIRDYHNLAEADIFMAFTEDPESAWVRGSRHVEMGLAIAWRKDIIVIGPKENIFCHLPGIMKVYCNWEEYQETL